MLAWGPAKEAAGKKGTGKAAACRLEAPYLQAYLLDRHGQTKAGARPGGFSTVQRMCCGASWLHALPDGAIWLEARHPISRLRGPVHDAWRALCLPDAGYVPFALATFWPVQCKLHHAVVSFS